MRSEALPEGPLSQSLVSKETQMWTLPLNYYLLNTYYVLDTHYYLFLTQPCRADYCSHSHFTDKESDLKTLSNLSQMAQP